MAVGMISALKSFLRIQTYLLLSIYVIGGTMIGILQGGRIDLAGITAALVDIAAWYVNATSINDLADYEIDKVNLAGDADRPLVSKGFSRQATVLVAIVSGIVALVVSLVGGVAGIGIVAVMLALNVAYSLRPVRISRRGIWALLLLPLGYVGLTVGIGYIATGASLIAVPWGLVAALYVQFFARITLKDYRDVVGDAKFGKMTFLLRRGPRATARLAIGAHMLSVIGLVVFLPDAHLVGQVGLALLAGIGLNYLMRLAAATVWDSQRVWITAFGRISTGILVITFVQIGLAAGLVNGGIGGDIVIMVIVGVVILSAQRIIGQARVSQSS